MTPQEVKKFYGAIISTGKQLKEFRVNILGKSQDWLAQRSKYSTRQIAHIESKDKKITDKLRYAIVNNKEVMDILHTKKELDTENDIK